MIWSVLKIAIVKMPMVIHVREELLVVKRCGCYWTHFLRSSQPSCWRLWLWWWWWECVLFLLNRALFENKPTKLLKNMFAIVRIWVLRDCNLKSMFCVHAKIFHLSTKFGMKRREETISFFSNFSALFPSLTMVIMRSEHDSIHWWQWQ